jgi:DNA-binding transcriptional MocR family regulator
LRETYRRRRDAMLQALEKHFPAEAKWTRPAGGMFLMVHLPPSLSAAELLTRCLEKNVAFVPGEEFHLRGEGKNTLRLNFSNATPERITEGIRRIASLL